MQPEICDRWLVENGVSLHAPHPIPHRFDVEDGFLAERDDAVPGLHIAQPSRKTLEVDVEGAETVILDHLLRQTMGRGLAQCPN